MNTGPLAPGAEKLSFVGISGVKFGAAVLGGELRDFEIAILDVASMVGLGGGLGNFSHDAQTGNGLQDDGRIVMPPHATERLHTVMTGVRYRGDYRLMADWGDEQTSPHTWNEFYGILGSNHGRTNRHMKIDMSKDDGTFSVDVYLDSETTPCYSESGIALQDFGTIIVQTHWGSGVIFDTMDVTSK